MELGILAGLGSIANPDAAERTFYGLTIDWNSNVPAGQTVEANAKPDAQLPFVVEAIQMEIWTPSAVSTTIAGQPLARDVDASPPATVGNTWPTFGLARLQIIREDFTVFRTPVRCSLIAGDGRSPFYLPTKIVVPPSHLIRAQLTNDSAIAIRAQLLLHGFYLRPRGR